MSLPGLDSFKMESLSIGLDEPFSLAQLIDLFDRLVALSLTWLAGNQLSQTLFICKLLHNAPEIHDPNVSAIVGSFMDAAMYICDHLVAMYDASGPFCLFLIIKYRKRISRKSCLDIL